jgi:outer membrane protein assembly factor BamE (lipoprotein component of BamABCDE complex)
VVSSVIEEGDAMRIGAIVFIAALLLTSCAHLNLSRNRQALRQIHPGDTQEKVFSILGPPTLRHNISDQRFVAYYQTKPAKVQGAAVTPALCTPVAFENGKVAVIGQDPTDAWTLEEQARIHRATAAQREREKAEMAAAERNRTVTARRNRIKTLERKVRRVPASNASLNLKLYRQLLELAPDNPRYQRKVAFYENRWAQHQKARHERALQLAEQRRLRAWERSREGRNKALQQYTGNGIAEMAVHDMGNGVLYVWVKNVSQQVITTNPDNFTLMDSQDHKARCDISNSLDRVLEPGSISQGKIQYDRQIIPKALIFQNGESGRISKSFQ